MFEADEKKIRESNDISIIRLAVKDSEIKLRRSLKDKKTLKSIKSGLHTLHNLETMAVNAYKYQITSKDTELNRELIAAMLNEMTHVQDFQVKLYEYGWKPSICSYFFPIVGFIFANIAKLFGEKGARWLGVFVETKAVSHYRHLLETIDWDEDTRKIIEKDWADEFGHIERWRS
jgi:demethoxyubiquinone hydroxylase (CLK1/Coq7/Cat5 family)